MKELGWYDNLKDDTPLLLIFGDSSQEQVCLGKLIDNHPTSKGHFHITKVTKVFYDKIMRKYNTYKPTDVGDEVKASAGDCFILTEKEYEKFMNWRGKTLPPSIQKVVPKWIPIWCKDNCPKCREPCIHTKSDRFRIE